MNQENQKDMEETLITETNAYWIIDTYIIEKEHRGRIAFIEPTGQTMNRNSKFRNYEVRFIDGKVFTGEMHEDDYFTLVQKAKEEEKITIASSETCHLVLDEVKEKVC